MKFSPLIPGFIFIFPPVLILILYIFRVKKIMKKNNFSMSDVYVDEEKSKIFQKEMRKAYPYYWLMILMGLVLAYVVAIINKQ